MMLLAPDDPALFTVINDAGTARVLFVADHSGRAFPGSLNQLGLDDWVLEKHVAWDIGSDLLTRFLADELDAQAVLAGFSRLIVDPNRKLDDPTAFIEVSDGIAIPGNLDLDEHQKALRVESFFQPYHDMIGRKIDAFAARGIVPAFISIHTCTPVFDRVVRPWHIGIMWDRDPRIAIPLMEELSQMDGICIGDNEPYSGPEGLMYAIQRHGSHHALPCVEVELNQASLESERAVGRILAALEAALRPALPEPVS